MLNVSNYLGLEEASPWGKTGKGSSQHPPRVTLLILASMPATCKQRNAGKVPADSVGRRRPHGECVSDTRTDEATGLVTGEGDLRQ